MENLGFRPYVAGDIETTGLNKKQVDVLELGFVLDTAAGDDFISNFPTFHCYIKHDFFAYSEPFAIGLNHRYFSEYQKHLKGESQYLWLTPVEAASKLIEFLTKCDHYAISQYDKVKGWEKPINNVQIAGKNFGAFDQEVLNNFFLRTAPQHASQLRKHLGYKFIDVGSMGALEFGYVPGLDAINKLTGRTEVSHLAYSDAVDVIFAYRYYWCKTHGIRFNETTIFAPPAEGAL